MRYAALLLSVVLCACGAPQGAAPTATALPPAAPSAAPPTAPPPAATSAAPIPAEVAWLQANAAPIRSISPSDTDFHDLEPLRAAIGDARVVVLGEQSHGDGSTFLAKARLVAFLHQELGFEVLAFESGLYDCARAWDQIQGGAPARAAFAEGVLAIWSESAQVQPLVSYLAEQAAGPRPLELAGIDHLASSPRTRDVLAADLEQFLLAIGSGWPARPDWPGLAATLTDLVDARRREFAPITPDQLAALLAQIEELRAEIDERAPPAQARAAALWRQVLRGVAVRAEMAWAERDRSRRDRQMADNLRWMAETYYPERKIIVWAATLHALRDGPGINYLDMPGALRGWTSMGAFVHAALGEQVYTIGFAAHSGRAGAVGQEPTVIAPPQPGALEAHMVAAGLDLAFVDLRRLDSGGAWLREPQVSSSLLGYSPARARWPEQIDGLIFMRTMGPSTPAS